VIEGIVAERDRVAARYTESGIHTAATFVGLPPRGKHIVWSAVSIYRVEKGKLAEEWFDEDALGIWKQLGIVK
jgi:predicted ester cyclase